VVIAADNVTIRNCLRKGIADYWGFLVNAGVTGTLIEDVEIDGMNSSTIDAGVGGGGGWTGRRLNIHGTADGIKIGSNLLLEDSYVHDLKTPPNGAHSDSAQSMGGSNVTLRHNTFTARVGVGQNSAVFLAPDFGPIKNYTVDNNLLSGGGFSMWAYAASNSRITNNHFGRLYGYGPIWLGSGWTRSGNVWHDTLQPIPGG
jgi:hypothetical protein